MLDGFSNFDPFLHMQQYEPNLQGSDGGAWQWTRKLFRIFLRVNWNFIIKCRGQVWSPSLGFFYWPRRNSHSGPRPSHCRGFMITLRHTIFGRTPLDEWPARRRDLYLTTHNIRKRQTSMPPAGFEPTIPASQRPQTHALDHAATGIGRLQACFFENHRHYRMIIYTN
jgi:hypothetical protein